MKVQSYVGNYEAAFYSDFSFLGELCNQEHKFIIIDAQVYGLYKDKLRELLQGNPCYQMEAVEENKTIQEALTIMRQMLELPSKRNTRLVAIGGGIVQDVSAFIANVLYRGISWTLLPTTLLAQTDSCIGSKSSLNFEQYKNILGYFYPPGKIYVNTNFIHTLQEKDYLSGLGEIIKCALMAGYESFLATRDHLSAMLERREDILLQEIQKALAFKKTMIERDEFDRGPRNLMNFGHTFGHALESVSHYEIPHGQAVSYGILLANEVSLRRGYIPDTLCQKIRQTISRIVTPGLMTKEYLTEDAFLGTMKHDKKYTGGLHTCILFHGDGVEKHSDVTDDEIRDAIQAFLRDNNHADSL